MRCRRRFASRRFMKDISMDNDTSSLDVAFHFTFCPDQWVACEPRTTEREPGRSDFVFYPQEPSELLHSLREKFVESSGADHAEIDEPCPRCGNPKMRFTTVQMRSADEGQTVIYNCPQCNHTFQQNT
uniref:DNA-directed RNA polymerase I subunit RPA12 n=1 Tax=Compsopogon caeruleus TaxID=31354 RepID=A0A7S1X931_9RHOD|mmetsp:Transcript_10259/g.20697  ORF Transcript_10259/g.20697 Transcript_10259/m.20697 type:complete len:128 (+) Transcript_10259:285-668(+)